MNRNPSDIKDYQINKFISRSMIAYPADKSILPLAIHMNILNLSEIQVEQYTGEIIKCRLCHAFFNPYCIIHEESNNWRCSICGAVNHLPLPSKDSFTSAYLNAKNLVCYNNSVFDVIKPFEYKNIRPKILIAIQSKLYSEFKNILSQSIYHNNKFSYSLILFDEKIQIFDFHSKYWHVLSDIEKDEDFFFPTNEENLFGTSYDVQSILNSEYQPKSYHENIKIEHICHIVSNLQNTKLLLIISGPIINILPKINFPGSIVFYGIEHSLSICKFINWSKIPTTNLIHFKHKITESLPPSIYRQIHNFLYKSLQLNFESNIEIRLKKPKFYDIPDLPNDDYHFYVISRNSTPNLSSFLQFEITYTNVMGIPYCRYINFRVPLSPDPRVFRSATFPSPLLQAMTTARFFVSCIFDMTIKNYPMMKIYNTISEMSYRYPLTENYWPHFFYKLLLSDILNVSLSTEERISLLLPLMFLPPALLYLKFLQLQYVDGKLLPLFPKALNEAKARVTDSEILTIDDSYKNIIKILNINERDLLVVNVQSFPEIKDEEEAFQKWKHDWDLSIYNSKYERQSKSKK